MAHSIAKTEMKGTSGGRWETREVAKKGSRSVRRHLDKTEVGERFEEHLEEVTEFDDLWDTWSEDDECRAVAAETARRLRFMKRLNTLWQSAILAMVVQAAVERWEKERREKENNEGP